MNIRKNIDEMKKFRSRAILHIYFFISLFLFYCAPTPIVIQKPFGLPSKHIINNVPRVHQGRMECAPAAMAMVLNHWGLKKTIDELKEPLKWHPVKGVHPYNIISLAYKLGFRVDAPEVGSLERILEHIAQDHPVIVRQWLNYDAKYKITHYRVVIGYDDEKQKIYMRDSDITRGGLERASYKEFIELWDLTDDPKFPQKNCMLVLIPWK